MQSQEPDHAKRARAVDALARGESNSAAARTSGYSRVWIQKLRKDPDFLAEVGRRREQLAAAPADPEAPVGPPPPPAKRLVELEEEGLEFLSRVVKGKVKDAKPTHQVQAAKALVAHAALERARSRPGPPTTDMASGAPAVPAPAAAEGKPPLKLLDPLSPEAQADADAFLDAQA